MAVTELSRVIDSVTKDKGVEREAVIRAVEEAVLSAAHKLFRMEGKTKELEVRYNEETGEVEIFEFKTVVEKVNNPDVEISMEEAVKLDPDVELGDSIGIKINPDFTRIAIQNAKQKILQKLREAEGKVILEEFKTRKGELISGIIRRIERKNVIVDIGRTEAILPPEHQVPKEYYRPKERIRAVLIDIKETKRGPQLILSRSHPDFVKRLFEAEVPEISEGIVEIKAIARDPGSRTKIAVASNDPDVDPVGACVGMQGSRVQNIIQELKGEKIDIVPWSSDPARFVCNALSPARVSKVIIDENNRSMEVIVDDDQLSLAIGRRGQNVRLASKLTDWKIDIKTESQVKREQQEVISLLMTLPNIGEVTANLLYNEGFHSLEDIAFADPEALVKAAGLKSIEDAKKIQTAARIALKDKLEKMSVSEQPPTQTSEGQ
ncbi:MAG: transcription termination/antitermination protein NusA [Deltaproteobacteria bacterium]|jgi:N utilization substance protein A|nr:Transcription termination/antitermination protein NusA [bacterium HR37]GIW47093.1 MAG: transcription termination/antitermination protein NusA [Deltaproteobacteria bacterium]